MAYKTKDNDDPFPHLAGEFCGNHKLGGRVIPRRHETQRRAEEREKQWLAGMRFGKPSSCEAGTSEEMAAAGYVGLYAKEDRSLFDWETPIETDALTEAVVTLTQQEKL